MKNNRAVTALVCLLAFLLAGCAKQADTNLYTPANDIISYGAIGKEKSVITVGKFYAFEHEALENALEAEFPVVDFVFVECSAGDKQLPYMRILADNNALPDLVLTNQNIPENHFLYDMGGEGFSSRYNLSSLQTLSVDEHLYQLPLSNTAFGIAYNKTLFDKNGWGIPATKDELLALCDTISANGIRPFVTCMKYFTTVESLMFGMGYQDTFATAEQCAAYAGFQSRDETCRGVLDAAYEAIKNLYDHGLITEDDFSSSATANRQDLYAGKIAMISSNLDIISLVQSEKPEAEIGFFGFPTSDEGRRVMQFVPGVKLSVNKASMEDQVKSKQILDILDYISTDAGQDTVFQTFSGVSTLTSYQQSISAISQDVSDCISSGNIFFANYYGSNSFIPTIKQYVTGTISLDELLAATDALGIEDPFASLLEPPIGKASETFTVLDTSIFNADVLREATGADIALVPNMSFYFGNLACIFMGDIVLASRFTPKGISGKAALTTYQITGANLKALLEHPTIDNIETNILYAVSGLKVTYAPWAGADANVKAVALSDGTKLDDNAVYIVAAWPGAISEQYIQGIAETFEDAGKNADLMAAAIQKKGLITPARDGRITLDWNTVR